MEKLQQYLSFELISFKDFKLTILQIIGVVIIFIITKMILFFIKKGIERKRKFDTLDPGSSYALLQLAKYFFWILASGVMLETLGIRLSFLLAGSAALLVGVGLGLQQTFNDIVSGILLLFEQSVKVEDILEVDGDVIQIKEIGLRTSRGLTRDDTTIRIPNSMITTNKVVNWSNETKEKYFGIDIGIAYGSDVEKVMKILISCAKEHPDVVNSDNIVCRFTNFGSSSLDFSLYFQIIKLFEVSRVKSELRVSIYKKLQNNNIEIPFPQMDVHFPKNNPPKIEDA